MLTPKAKHTAYVSLCVSDKKIVGWIDEIQEKPWGRLTKVNENPGRIWRGYLTNAAGIT